MIGSGSGKKDERGYALLWTLFFSTLLYLLVLAFFNTSLMENFISINHYRDVQAFAMADGGATTGTELIYQILQHDYCNCPEIPEQLLLEQQDWRFDEAGLEMGFYLENPSRLSLAEGQCVFRFVSKGDCAAAHKKLQVDVRVEFIDYYLIQYAEDGTALLVFDHREFVYPSQIAAIRIID